MNFRLLLVTLSIAASVRYLYWRLFYSVTTSTWPELILSVVLLLAEMYGIAVLFLGYFQTFKLKERKPVDLPADREHWPTVDVFVVTYNEQTELLRRTLIGALKMDYPSDKKKIYLLDDGRRAEMRELAEELGCYYITRTDNKHAKAGNLNNALRQTNGDIVAIFDSDQIPVKSFLTETVGFIVADEKCGLVQTPQHNFTASPFEHNLRLTNKISSEEDFFYRVAQVGNDYWNSGYFCGCCAILRRSALEKIGGIAVETVGEDAHTSMRLHAAGYRSVYFNKPLTGGLATARFEQYLAQRVRWGRGMAQILRIQNPLFTRGLSIPQRLNYFLSIMHFFGGVPRMVLILAPLVYLLLGWMPVNSNSLNILYYAVPHILLAIIAMSAMSKGYRQSFWSEVFQTATAFALAPVTFLALINPRLGKFTVTSKRLLNTNSRFNFKYALPTIIMIAISVAAIGSLPYSWVTRPAEHTALMINTGWALHNLVILVAVMLAARNRIQLRDYPRVDLKLPCSVISGRSQITGFVTDLSECGARAVLFDCDKLPGRFDLRIESDFGETATIKAKLVWRDVTGNGKMICGFSFPELNKQTHQSVIALAFCDPKRWLDDRFPADRPWRSYWYILSTGIRTFRREIPYKTVPPSVLNFQPVRVKKENLCTNAQFGVQFDQSQVPTNSLHVTGQPLPELKAFGAAGSE